MLLNELDYARPATVDAAVAALASRPHARVLAGGQSLVNVLKARAAAADLLVDVSRLSELQGIEIRDGVATIGAGTTHAEIAASASLGRALPRLCEMAAHIVDVQVRNRGTIGGNCCYADPCSNFPPLLIALDARLRLTSGAGERVVPAGEFFVGAFRTAARPGELLRSVEIPLPGRDVGVGYSTIQLMPDIWALARAAAVVEVEAGGTIASARVVVAAVEPVPRRQRGVERLLVASAPTTASVAAAADAVDELADAIGDVHGSAEYRRRLARVVVKRAVREALAGAGVTA